MKQCLKRMRRRSVELFRPKTAREDEENEDEEDGTGDELDDDVNKKLGGRMKTMFRRATNYKAKSVKKSASTPALSSLADGGLDHDLEDPLKLKLTFERERKNLKSTWKETSDLMKTFRTGRKRSASLSHGFSPRKSRSPPAYYKRKSSSVDDLLDDESSDRDSGSRGMRSDRKCSSADDILDETSSKPFIKPSLCNMTPTGKATFTRHKTDFMRGKIIVQRAKLPVKPQQVWKTGIAMTTGVTSGEGQNSDVTDSIRTDHSVKDTTDFTRASLHLKSQTSIPPKTQPTPPKSHPGPPKTQLAPPKTQLPRPDLQITSCSTTTKPKSKPLSAPLALPEVSPMKPSLKNDQQRPGQQFGGGRIPGKDVMGRIYNSKKETDV